MSLNDEESKEETIFNLKLAPFNHGGVSKTTLFFSTHEPNFVYNQLINTLKDWLLTPEMCPEKGRLTYT